MEKVKIASSSLVSKEIMSKEISGIGISKSEIEISVNHAKKRIVFKLNELDEDGFPCVYIGDTLEAKSLNKVQ